MAQCMTTAGLAEKMGEMELRPRLDLEVSRHVFSNRVTYILRDPITFESHRMSVSDYEIFVQLSSGKPLKETFASLVASDLVAENDQEDFYRYGLSLVQLGLLGLPSPDGKSLFNRAEQRQSAVRKGVLKNFLFQQIPLFNPDQFLDRTVHLVRFVFSKWFMSLWFCGMIAAITIVFRRWNEFTDPLADILTLQNIPLLWSILFGLKIIHEFGHAYACKLFGGNVPAMGLYLIAGNPCAFVDASAAWGFPSRLHRVIVSLGGMYVESIVGIIAVFVWAFSSSPLVSSCAHHIVFMATAVTLLFNANPLMKYDGYFILCDLTGSPNLRQRSQNELEGLMKKHLLGLNVPTSKLTFRTLALIVYGIAASLYKVLVVISISSMVAMKFAVLGLAMGGYYAVTTIYGIYSKTLQYLWSSPEVQPVKLRARGFGYAMLALLPLLLLTPIPTGTRSTGRLTTQNEFVVTNETAGVVTDVFAEPGQSVGEKHTIAQLRNENIVAQQLQGTSEVDSSRLQYFADLEADQRQALQSRSRLEFAESQLKHISGEVERLEVRSETSGTITSCLPETEVGTYLAAGSTVATVGSGPWVVKLLATAETMNSSRPIVGQDVSVRLKSQPGRLLRGKIVRIAELGNRIVEDTALTHLAGGNITVNPATNEAQENFFEIDVQPEPSQDTKFLHGMTAEVRMNRRVEFVGKEIYRRIAKFIDQIITS